MLARYWPGMVCSMAWIFSRSPNRSWMAPGWLFLLLAAAVQARQLPPTATPVEDTRLQEAAIRAEQEITTAESALAVFRKDPALAGAEWLETANRNLKRARIALGDGRRDHDLVTIVAAGEIAAKTRSDLEVIMGNLATARQQEQDRDRRAAIDRRGVLAEITILARAAQKDLDDSAELGNEGQLMLVTPRAELVSLLAIAEGEISRPVSPKPELEALRDGLRTRTTAFRQAWSKARALTLATPTPLPGVEPRPAPTPPQTQTRPAATLSEAAQAFAEAEYGTVVRLLAKCEDSNPRVAAVCHLLRGAAYFYSYREQGEQDQLLRAKAAADVGDCYRFDPSVRPQTDIFSPVFVEFFAANLAPEPNPANQPDTANN